MKKIIGIKCKDMFYISEFESDSYYKYSSLKNLIINGKNPKETFHSGWCVINEEPILLQKYIKQPSINYRYELIDVAMQSDKTPLVLKANEVAKYIEYEWIWNDEFKIYKSLYELHFDKQSDILEDIDFEYETIMEVKKIKEYGGFAYDVQKTQWKRDGLETLGEREIYHQLIDEIIFPDILLPNRPSSLTSKQSFDIVREYVKQNINFEVATITSDYDFCFTVKKKIPLSEAEEYRVDVNNLWGSKRKRKPKYEKRYHKFREIECFNMAPKSYQKYKVIDGFRGKNQDDLKNNIDDYCRNLIEFINEPITDCPNCKGRGVITNEKI